MGCYQGCEPGGGRSQGMDTVQALHAAGTGQVGHLRIAHLTPSHLMHNLRAGANSAWAYSVPPKPVLSVGRPMCRFRYGNLCS
jgi:hypothetical protein